MRLFRIVRNRIRALVGRDGVVDEIHEEIQFHLDARSVEHQRRGLSPDEARRAALRKFGNPSVVEDQGYDVRGGGVMESFVQDARYGMRLLWKQRGFSAVALLTLALGTGATTAIFCVVDAALIRPLPYDKPEQLVRVGLVAFSRPDVTTAPSLVDMDDWRTLTHVFSHLGTTKSETAILLEGSDPERVNITLATLDYLPMYGRTPFIGRPFTADDEQLGAPAVVILGYRFWQTHFQGDPAVVGRTLRFVDQSDTIIGVLPDDGSRVQTPVWRPLRATAAARGFRQYAGWARLRDGVAIEDAQREVSALAARLERERPENKGMGARITREYDNATRPYRPTINVLLGAVGFVLLIACVNVASLQLARGATRETELAIRASIGAGRGRLVRQVLTESVVLSLAGSALGALLAWLLLDVLAANIPVRISSDVQVRLNAGVLAATIGLAVIAGVLSGLAPALKLSRTELNAVLGRGSRGIRSTVSKAATRLLVTIEVAAAVLLVSGAALMIRSFARLSAFDLGFNPNGFVTLEVQPVDPAAPTFGRSTRRSSTACAACPASLPPAPPTTCHWATVIPWPLSVRASKEARSSPQSASSRCSRAISKRWPFRFVPAGSLSRTTRSARLGRSSANRRLPPCFQTNLRSASASNTTTSGARSSASSATCGRSARNERRIRSGISATSLQPRHHSPGEGTAGR